MGLPEMGPDCLNHFDAAGYFILYMILLFDFFFSFPENICSDWLSEKAFAS